MPIIVHHCDRPWPRPFDVIGKAVGAVGVRGPTQAPGCANPEEDRFVIDERFTDTTSLWIARKGSNEPQLLHKMSADWFAPQDGVLQTTPFHPHPRFLPNGTGLVFNSGGEIDMVEM